MTTRILHFSDTHLGKRQYKSDIRKDDFSNAFNESINISINRDVDAVIHTGDLFDSSTPNSSALQVAFEGLRKLSDAGIPFYSIVGNHEQKRDVQWMDILSNIDNVYRLGREPCYVNNIALYGVDSMSKTRWGASESFNFVESNEDTEFTLVCMHQLIHPPVPEYIYERSADTYSAKDVLDKINLSVDAVLLGDYHVRSIDKENNVKFFYPGSTERTDRSDETNKSVDIIEIENSVLRRNQVFLESPREFQRINISVVDGMGLDDIKNKLDGYDIDGCVVDITLTGSTEAPFTVQQIRGLGEEMDATLVRVSDNREQLGEIELDGSMEEISDIDSVLDEQIESLDLSEEATQVETLIRESKGLSDSKIRDRVGSIMDERISTFEGDSE